MQSPHQFFLLQAAIFLPYHRDLRNWLLHNVGLPTSVFGFMIALAWVEFFDIGSYTVSLATVAVIPAMVFWMLADLAIGLVATLFYAGMLVLADRLAGLAFVDSAIIAVGLFTAGMVLQLVGHIIEDGKLAAEGAIAEQLRAPRLFRLTWGTPNCSSLYNLVQMFVVPMVLFATISFKLGFKKSLQAEMERHPKVGSLER